MTGPADAGIRSDTGRLEAFSDGVLAIVITLLVLDLRVPGVRPGRLLTGLFAQWPGYLAYLASFLYVAVVWLNHKSAFKRINQTDRPLTWCNFFILFTTALLPFPTAVVSHAMQEKNQPDERVAVALYALVGALHTASWLAFFQYLTRHRDLVADGVGDRFFPAERLRALAGIVLYALAALLGILIAPLISLVIFVLLPAFYALTSAGLYQLGPVARRMSSR